ncbi:septum formation initiator family protein [Lachnospiraceae bacterium ZAX-1]
MGQGQGQKYTNTRVNKAKNKRRRKQNRAGMMCVSIIVLMVLIVFSIQILKLSKKNEEYKQQETQLLAQLETEQGRQEEIKEYEQHVKTKDYIEQIAKTRLGLVNPNEIIFREIKPEP